jgi:4-hydroxybenzoate polyprenyltransferase/phosphoserine phosphatase
MNAADAASWQADARDVRSIRAIAGFGKCEAGRLPAGGNDRNLPTVNGFLNSRRHPASCENRHCATRRFRGEPEDDPLMTHAAARSRDTPPAGASAPVAEDALLPLAVDLDGTLLSTDTLFEAIAEHMRVRPIWTLLQLLLLPFAIAKVKARLQRSVDLGIASLPVNDDVLAYCREAKAAGRPVWLVTAADRSVAEPIAAHFGLFDRVLASDGVTNLKGRAKAQRLRELAPDGFEYIGDSPADLKVWAHAKRASVVGGGEPRLAAVRASGAGIARTFARDPLPLRAWAKELRPHQWAKNVLIFVAPLLAMKLDPETLLRLALAFPLIGLVASGTYIINDLLDLRADRAHHSKRKRPFAAGRLKLWQGFVAAPLLIGAGAGGAFLLSVPFGITVMSYLVITLCYSLMLKRAPMVDTLLLAFLYTLRVVMGAALTATPLTEWFLVFCMFLFVSLSFAKRHVEVVRKAAAGETRIANRGYVAEDAPLTLALGIATATVCPVILALYILDASAPTGLYANPEALWIAPVVVSIWLMRVWLLANRAELHDDPVIFAIKDPQSLALVAFLAASFVYATVGLPAGVAGIIPAFGPAPGAP